MFYAINTSKQALPTLFRETSELTLVCNILNDRFSVGRNNCFAHSWAFFTASQSEEGGECNAALQTGRRGPATREQLRSHPQKDRPRKDGRPEVLVKKAHLPQAQSRLSSYGRFSGPNTRWLQKEKKAQGGPLSLTEHIYQNPVSGAHRHPAGAAPIERGPQCAAQHGDASRSVCLTCHGQHFLEGLSYFFDLDPYLGEDFSCSGQTA